MNAIRLFLFGLGALTLVLLGMGLFLPQRAHIERSILIDRPPATVFTVLNGFRSLEQWSPWADLDPQMKTEFAGPAMGVGARYSWTSEHAAVGSGSQEIIDSTPYTRITVKLQFSGMSTQNQASYTLSPEGQGTRVVWDHDADFSGDYFSRYFGLLMDRMIGADYERGLQRLKTHVESLPSADFAGIDIQLQQLGAQTIAYVSASSSTEPEVIARAYAAAFERIGIAMSRDAVAASGPVLVIGRRWDAEANRYEFDAAVPVPADIERFKTDQGVRIGKTYAGLALRAVHQGAQSGLGPHLQALMAYKRAAGFVDNGSPWDVYVSDPAITPESERITETYVPVK
ncbi:MAG: SRPBCC family protein [Panacagrimonas sp.]